MTKAIADLPNDTIIDGEIVALDENGKPSFNLLQGFGDARAIVLYAFDLLMLRGKDVRLWRLEDRREQLREIIPALPDTIRYSETFNVPTRMLNDVARGFTSPSPPTSLAFACLPQVGQTSHPGRFVPDRLPFRLHAKVNDYSHRMPSESHQF